MIVLLLGLGVSGVLPGPIVLGGYLATLLLDAGLALREGRPWREALWVPLTGAVIHLGYGVGLLVGLLRWIGGRPLGSGAIRAGRRLSAKPAHETGPRD